MSKRIFQASFVTSIIVVLLSAALIFAVLYRHLEAQLFKELKNEVLYISAAVKNEGDAYIDSFNNSEKRITLISADGTVIKDTSADVTTLDNHMLREEIASALETGEGQSVRYSDTLMEKNLYYAKRLDDGSVLRVSATQNSVGVLLLGLLQPLVMAIMAALIASFYISKVAARAIVRPINSMDLDNPKNNKVYEELTPLLRKLSAQKVTIDRQIRDAKQKQDEFNLICENMSEGLLIVDYHTNVLTYNRAALKLLETDGATKGKTPVINRKKSFREAVEGALMGERVQREIAFEDKHYDIIASPVYEDTRIIGAVIVIVDVTERERREQLRREFTSNVSHELKTPLTSISGFAEMIMAGDMPEDTLMDFSRSIYDEAQRLIGLVADIIKLSEIEEKQIDTEKKKIKVRNIAAGVMERLEPFAKKRGIKMTLSGDDGEIRGSERILDEMIFNLCDNAVKYNKENGQVVIEISEDGKNVTVRIKDSGIGIPQSDIERVFERFYRVDKSHSKEIGGTGLGLSIVKHGAMYHGASVDLSSRIGEGTCVTLTFKK